MIELLTDGTESNWTSCPVNMGAVVATHVRKESRSKAELNRTAIVKFLGAEQLLNQEKTYGPFVPVVKEVSAYRDSPLSLADQHEKR